ncbi:phosphohistidine phosphatase SixA [Dongshaea marina]|uniref:phosphohistidine phosphatase SixA n=1 Tax=Dongshaea marina TaxID=2047966 RepID=UPI000D3E9D97|nr:phosphohistidine phosphatase SixA [Dongshaea marina]
MRVFIMRHGQAVTHASRDALRPLTDVGKQESRAVGYWLRDKISELDYVMHSSYLRAQQTWQIISDILPTPKRVDLSDEIVPHGDPQLIADYLLGFAEHHGYQNILLVSHLPFVGYLVSELASHQGAPIFPTSGVACIEIEDNGDRGELRWLEGPHSI